MKKLPPSKRVCVKEEFVAELKAQFGEQNVQVTEAGI